MESIRHDYLLSLKVATVLLEECRRRNFSYTSTSSNRRRCEDEVAVAIGAAQERARGRQDLGSDRFSDSCFLDIGQRGEGILHLVSLGQSSDQASSEPLDVSRL